MHPTPDAPIRHGAQEETLTPIYEPHAAARRAALLGEAEARRSHRAFARRAPRRAAVVRGALGAWLIAAGEYVRGCPETAQVRSVG